MSETFFTDLYGEHSGRHPSMGDLKNRLSVQVKEKLANEMADDPRTAYLNYEGRIRKVKEHGKLYENPSHEEVTYGPDGSDTGRHGWRGWTTAHLRVTFDAADI
ncbi:hypothetical protein CBS63078_7630 [Aspergillus niger]|uniref:Uncharacterized protein n=4 Tax=Aspergillus TaxID=5052 RepID=A2QWQ8_ASPNC|nr:hypothetical protein An11g06070 [Aspergillus niger]XP_025448458.1 uncharacterized protein BO96DRAFT_451481 [Aspergillus niger CBS 101883]RDH21175.1 hypothetical protein M747DRAFT_340554 [Aspergillus niger ATCC 13496]RDK40905.1 hypothetical protein M752DRAFT_267230 [Aspergillus phoenicis ATCC 13157]KAI2812968.1 hypothetical protein CBS115989_9908 [Aspergillus niger]KAI2838263.1 hypothetical protein CBS11232_9668 [Aspergillus niger]KAI2843076.1 hypothetical protein CBS11350_5355 [Aspergillus|eukprot:XP_001394591.1 hypothetical protein ANI_1_2120094 [Aspergillus niger CBS 513.88]